MAPSNQLRPYQVEGVRKLHTARRIVLADEPGLGKTVQLLRASQGRTLVVCPADIQQVWRSEHAKWTPDLDLTIVSYHSLVDFKDKRGTGDKAKHTGKPRPEYDIAWDTLIFDEAHNLKGRDTTYARAGIYLAERAKRVYLATGTPLPNWAHELFMLLRAIHGTGDRRFSSYWRWVDRWFTVHLEEVPGRRNAGKTRRVVGELRDITDWDTFVKENGLEGRWLRRYRDDVLPDLPPLTQQTLKVKMKGTQARVYREFKKAFFSEFNGTEVVSWDEGGQWQKLLRMSSGLECLEEEQGNTKASAKMDALRTLMADRGEVPTLVFCFFRKTGEAVSEAMVELGFRSSYIHGGVPLKEREKRVRDFTEGRLDVLVGSYGTLSEGVTLVEADTVIRFERSPRPGTNEQAIRRIHRMGQTRPCLCIDLVTEKTVDENLLKYNIRPKEKQQGEVMRALDLL